MYCTLENSFKVFYEIKRTLTFIPSSSSPRYLYKCKVNLHSHKNLYVRIMAVLLITSNIWKKSKYVLRKR